MQIFLLSISSYNWSSLIGAFGGALLSGLIAIWIFWKQSKNEKKKKKEDLARENERKLDYLKGSLHHYIDMVHSVLLDKKDTFQKNEELAKNSMERPFEAFPHKIEINGSLMRLLELNPKEIRMAMLTYFNDKEKAFKSFKGIYNMLDYYNVHGQKSKETILLIKKENYQLQLEIKKRGYELRVIVAEYTAKIKRENQDPSKHPLYDHFNSTLIDYVKGLEEQPTLEFHRDTFANRLLKIANSETTGIEGANDIFNKAHEFVMLYFDLEQKGQEMYDTITNNDSNYKEVNDKLEEVLKRDYEEFIPSTE